MQERIHGKEEAEAARNILGIFAVCSLSVAMFRSFGEHLGNISKENIFLKVLNGKVTFVLKVYDLIITNVDLLTNSSNHKVIIIDKFAIIHNIRGTFYECCFKNFPRISSEYCKVLKIFLEVKKFRKWICGLSCENFNIGSLLSCNVFLNFVETVLHLE